KRRRSSRRSRRRWRRAARSKSRAPSAPPESRMATSSVGKKIQTKAGEVHRDILKRRQPNLKFPLRSLSNVRYDPKAGHFEMRGRKKVRTLTVSTVKTFAQTLRMMALSKELVA